MGAKGIVCQHLTVARVSEGLGVSWNTANDAVPAEGRCVLIEDPHRFGGVRVIGVEPMSCCIFLRRRATLRGAVAGQAQPARRSRAAKDASSHHDEMKLYYWYAHYPRPP